MEYTIEIDEFEGPFDLLLFFIQRDELNIYDVPIAKITEDYLNYLQNLSAINVNKAGEFILMASTLMRIKSQMLLPLPTSIDNEDIDPRAELIQNLVEYKKIKDQLPFFEFKELKRDLIRPRGNATDEYDVLLSKYVISTDAGLYSISKLHGVMLDVLKSYNNRMNNKKYELEMILYEISEERLRIYELLERKSQLFFRDIFASCESKLQAIVRFLSLLSELSNQKLRVSLGTKVNSIMIERLVS